MYVYVYIYRVHSKDLGIYSSIYLENISGWTIAQKLE